MATPIGERVAALEQNVLHLTREVTDQRVETRTAFSETKNDIEAVRKEVEKLTTLVSEGRGGLKMLVLLGGVSGSIGAALTYVLKLLPLLPRA